MRSPLFRTIALVSCSFLFLITPNIVTSADKSEPQLVRVSYAQGEVKFSPGKNGKPDLGADWLQAPPDLTLEQGYSLASENGRAIVEFENGSVAYLAEHSVLQFEKLQIQNGITTTHLNLLTGTATIVHVSKGQDVIIIDTPAVRNITYRRNISVRIDSTLNGSVIHAIDASGAAPAKTPANELLTTGQTVAFIDGRTFQLRASPAQSELDSWDKWVDAQRLDHAADLQKAMQESGLTQPIPGLADLAKDGHFFDCPPYGKCWEPNAPAANLPQGVPQAGAAPPAASPAPTTGPRPYVINKTALSRCPMETWMYSVGRPSRPGVLNAHEPEHTFRVSGFPWAGCFAGAWIYSCWDPASFFGFDPSGAFGGYAVFPAFCPQPRLVYVVGHRRWKHPIRIVKLPHSFGFIPRHPLDQKGKPPLNAKNGVLTLALNKGELHAGFESAPKTLQLETNLPRAFTEDHNLIATVPKAAPPDIQGRMIHVVTSTADARREFQAAALPQNQIHYDYKTHNFVAPRTSPAAAGSNSSPIVVAHLGSHGVSGGSIGHASGANNYSGGGHVGGGSSTSGGGGHSGGSGGGAGAGHSGSSSSAGGGGGSSGGGSASPSSSGGGAAPGGHH